MEKTGTKDMFTCFEHLIENHAGFAETLPEWIQDNAPESIDFVFSESYFSLVEKFQIYAHKKSYAFSQMPPTFYEFCQ